MTGPVWVEHVIWWQIYPLGFVGAFPADAPPEELVGAMVVEPHGWRVLRPI